MSVRGCKKRDLRSVQALICLTVAMIIVDTTVKTFGPIQPCRNLYKSSIQARSKTCGHFPQDSDSCDSIRESLDLGDGGHGVWKQEGRKMHRDMM